MFNKDVFEQHFGDVNDNAVLRDIESTSKVKIYDIDLKGSTNNTPTTLPTHIMQFPTLPANSNKDGET